MKTKISSIFLVAVSLLTVLSGLLTPLAVRAQTCGAGEMEVKLGVEVKCQPGTPGENVIFTYLASIIRFLATGVGLVIVLAIIIAGIQYITAAGNPQGLEAAKGRLGNAIIALLLFIFMFAALNFLIPGGLIG